MELSKEEKLKYWISIVAKGALILFIFIKGYHYLFQYETNKEQIQTNSTELSKDFKVLDNEEQQDDVSKSKISIPASLEKSSTSFTTISKVIKYNGAPLENAHFTIDACHKCSSTRTSKDGVTQIKIPNEIYQDGLTHQFYVFQGDSLMYQKSMRFINLQLDEY